MKCFRGNLNKNWLSEQLEYVIVSTTFTKTKTNKNKAK